MRASIKSQEERDCILRLLIVYSSTHTAWNSTKANFTSRVILLSQNLCQKLSFGGRFFRRKIDWGDMKKLDVWHPFSKCAEMFIVTVLLWLSPSIWFQRVAQIRMKKRQDLNLANCILFDLRRATCVSQQWVQWHHLQGLVLQRLWRLHQSWPGQHLAQLRVHKPRVRPRWGIWEDSRCDGGLAWLHHLRRSRSCPHEHERPSNLTTS